MILELKVPFGKSLFIWPLCGFDLPSKGREFAGTAEKNNENVLYFVIKILGCILEFERVKYKFMRLRGTYFTPNVIIFFFFMCKSLKAPRV